MFVTFKPFNRTKEDFFIVRENSVISTGTTWLRLFMIACKNMIESFVEHKVISII